MRKVLLVVAVVVFALVVLTYQSTGSSLINYGTPDLPRGSVDFSTADTQQP